MKLNFRNLLIMFLSLLLLGILSGCSSRDKKKASKKRQNHYEPITLTSDEDTIRIKYFDVNSNAQHEQALQLIIDHCGDSYIETTRMNETGYTTVEAECTHDTYSQ
jgi:hypothetical protein